jgi:hypothetical protein
VRNDDASFSYARSPFDGGRRPCDDGYGHAIHFSQSFSFASEEAGAISEGFGDYWAVTVSDVVARALGVPELEPLPCVADWDSTSYTCRTASAGSTRTFTTRPTAAANVVRQAFVDRGIHRHRCRRVCGLP